jgi:hypothetical protein
MKLYRSTTNPARWFAFSPSVGWVMFPAAIGGWQNRQPARGMDPVDVREVPLHLGFNAGIPGARKSAQRRLRRLRTVNSYKTQTARAPF